MARYVIEVRRANGRLVTEITAKSKYSAKIRLRAAEEKYDKTHTVSIRELG